MLVNVLQMSRCSWKHIWIRRRALSLDVVRQTSDQIQFESDTLFDGQTDLTVIIINYLMGLY